MKIDKVMLRNYSQTVIITSVPCGGSGTEREYGGGGGGGTAAGLYHCLLTFFPLNMGGGTSREAQWGGGGREAECIHDHLLETDN